MLFFLISAFRAIVEMLLLCLLAQGFLYVLAGQARQKNPIYRFFALITRGPRQAMAFFLPAKLSPPALAIITVLLLWALWLGLALVRKLI